ncbi:tripartite tricarboxylate transporter substrate binding protein [Bordetella sp. FB-8]|uniref:tripartite tricarboxylate transporter substrate binding protein n=1 Tax=Bordetella sp. FB-8 TaxID=1159870 RepID=UPI0003740C05|nr:tripartite tricarboxylate transporter substrate binding protein [Bordetella sp. FB-8]
MHHSCTRMLGPLALLAALAAPALAHAEDAYPRRPVTIIVGFAPGGATDIDTRLIAKPLAAILKQPVIVENKAGAGSNIGAEFVAHAQPDGYTLYLGSIANAINMTLYHRVNYDFNKDFAPIGLAATIPNILVVNPKLPVKSVRDYIAYAKAHPNKLTCASSGVGSSIHLSCELFKMQTHTGILHVPYRGSGPAMAGLLSGQIDSMFDNLPSSLPHVRAGQLRALAVTSMHRIASEPQVPTLAESGLPDYHVQSWFGLVAPAATPRPIIDKLNAALVQALADPGTKALYEKDGFTLPELPNTPQTFGKLMADETVQWRKVIKAAHISVN